MLTPRQKANCSAKAHLLQPILQVGKNGLSDSFIAECALLAKKKGLIKVRLLKSFAHDNESKDVAALIASKTKTELVTVVGNMLVLVHSDFLRRSNKTEE